MKKINMHLSSPIYCLCFSETVSVKFEHLIKTMQRTHYSKAVIRTKFALQEVSFDWLIYLRTLKMHLPD